MFLYIPVVWAALLLAQSLGGGLPEIITNLTAAMEHPFRPVLRCLLVLPSSPRVLFDWDFDPVARWLAGEYLFYLVLGLFFATDFAGYEVFHERQAPERDAPEQVQVRRQERRPQEAPVRPAPPQQEVSQRSPDQGRQQAPVAQRQENKGNDRRGVSFLSRFGPVFRNRFCFFSGRSGLFPPLRLTAAMEHPFHIHWTDRSLVTILACTGAYIMGICLYADQQGRTRDGEEHGSAAWASPRQVNAMFAQKQNKLLTKNVRLGKGL